MRLLTWNIKRDNKNLKKNTRKFKAENILSGIKNFDADIICLQEVPQNLLRPIKLTMAEKGYKMFQCSEYRRPNKKLFTRMLILTRVEVQNDGIISHRDDMFSSFHIRLQNEQQSIESMYVDVLVGSKKVRVFNTHLPLSVPPRVRMKYLDSILSHFDGDSENVVCGDFNPVSKFPFNVFWGWAHSYRLKDYLTYEPLMVRKKVKEAGLKSLFRFKCTHPITRQQLDYILAPKTLEIKEKKVISKRYKSDHKPLLVELATVESSTSLSTGALTNNISN